MLNMTRINSHLSLGLLAGAASVASAASLKDIKHIVLFMQENRAFDHVSVDWLTWSNPQHNMSI